MKAQQKWQQLGWRHVMWDLVRFYCSLAKQRRRLAAWLEELNKTKQLTVGESPVLPIAPQTVELFFEYIAQREEDFGKAFAMLRTEQDALAYCAKNGIAVGKVKTRNQQHYQSSKAMVAAVGGVATGVCQAKGVTFNGSPQTRCAWCIDNHLHVTARNLDGAIPNLANPTIVWEIKEYWGQTSGGSKMSDAVYECNLVGRELREYEEKHRTRVVHIVFVDGLIQWTERKADLKRFIDLMNQGIIDYLFCGKEVETEFGKTLKTLLRK